MQQRAGLPALLPCNGAYSKQTLLLCSPLRALCSAPFCLCALSLTIGLGSEASLFQGSASKTQPNYTVEAYTFLGFFLSFFFLSFFFCFLSPSKVQSPPCICGGLSVSLCCSLFPSSFFSLLLCCSVFLKRADTIRVWGV